MVVAANSWSRIRLNDCLNSVCFGVVAMFKSCCAAEMGAKCKFEEWIEQNDWLCGGVRALYKFNT
ncbi:MAG: hypothetical protein UZ06_CHB003001000 [Chlorobi bacterium OLB6]|nr:MAG: hypothetical protein UZ06_CHB003001000 [Chlorobi bacterium OLB6]